MGNDGGSIPTRSELVKTAKVKLINKRINTKNDDGLLCDLTNLKLEKPIVICKLGYIFNKESLLEKMVKKKLSKEFNHIKTLKDIKEVNQDSIINENNKQYNIRLMCPITLEEYCGNKK